MSEREIMGGFTTHAHAEHCLRRVPVPKPVEGGGTLLDGRTAVPGGRPRLVHRMHTSAAAAVCIHVRHCFMSLTCVVLTVRAGCLVPKASWGAGRVGRGWRRSNAQLHVAKVLK